MNKEEAINKIKEGASLSDIDPKFQKDRDVVLVAVTEDGDGLKFASDDLKNDKEIALAAISSTEGYPFEFISSKLWDDGNFVEEAVKIFPGSFEFASERILHDISFVLELMKKYDIPIYALSDKLRDDYEVFLEACKSSSNERSDFNFASKRLKSLESFMIEAIRIEPESIAYADDSLFESEEFVKKCLEISPDTAEFNQSISIYKQIKGGHTPFDLVNDASWKIYHSKLALGVGEWNQRILDTMDIESLIEAFDKGAEIDAESLYSYLVDEEIIDDFGEVLPILERQGLLLEQLKNLQNNYEAVMAAVKNNGLAYRFASPELRKNMQIAQAAVLSNPTAIDYISREVKNSDEWKSYMESNNK